MPWDEPRRRQGESPGLRLVVREMAFSENATYSATQRFLDAFGDDVDFSRWVAVWFYEETRHPYARPHRVAAACRLRRCPRGSCSKGRVSTPFMRSRVGTLVTNVVSEITAAQAYRRLRRATSAEPLLRRIAVRIAGDEARHAASFFRFARRQLAREQAGGRGSLRERARGLEVLHAWLGGATPATHPVAQMLERLGAAGEASIEIDVRVGHSSHARGAGRGIAPRTCPLRAEEDVGPALRELLARGRDAS